jgi:3-hydroxybutyryl-CoA dehydratase
MLPCASDGDLRERPRLMAAQRAPRVLESLSNYFDELVVGDTYVTPGRRVTDEAVVAFSAVSGDKNPLHTDPEWAKSGPFGAIVAQGLCTLAFASGLEFAFYAEGEKPTLAFYGYDRVRFVKPVLVGDTIHIEAEVTSLEEKDDTRGVVGYHQEIKNQRGETVVVLDKRTLMKASAYDQGGPRA